MIVAEASTIASWAGSWGVFEKVVSGHLVVALSLRLFCSLSEFFAPFLRLRVAFISGDGGIPCVWLLLDGRLGFGRGFLDHVEVGVFGGCLKDGRPNCLGLEESPEIGSVNLRGQALGLSCLTTGFGQSQ
jgi:hypothetical protein